MHRCVHSGVCRDVAAAQSRGTRAAVRAVSGWTSGDADRDLARVASSGGAARVQRHMILKDPRYSLALLCLVVLLSACKQPVAVAPPSAAPGEQAAAPSPSPSPTPPRPSGAIEYTDVSAEAGIRFKHNS